MRLLFSNLLLLSVLLTGCKQSSKTLFNEIAASKTGVTFKNILQESEQFNVLNYGYFYNGGGVAVGDINNDGLTDIYFTGNMVASHLYLNQGNFKFKNIAQDAKVAAAGLWNTGVTMADVNGDGWLDIYVCRSAANDLDARRNLLFINNKDLTFTESATQYGIDDPGYSTQASFFDYDRDGDLDLYVLNHSVQEFAGFSRQIANLKQRNNPIYGDRLYRNDNDRFTDVTEQSGILSNVLGFGLGITIEDFNNDGWLDIYISNDYNEQDYLYLNQQDGTFKEALAQCLDQTSLFSMGADAADLNNDGFPEILTLDMLPEGYERQKTTSGADNYNKKQSLFEQGFYHQTMRNMLHLNNGDGTFSEIGQLAGVHATDWSWAALMADLDLDGYKDIFITNGYKRDYTNMDFVAYAADVQIKSQKSKTATSDIVQDLIASMPSIEAPNYLFHNNADLTFTNQAKAWGLGKPSLSNGATYADLDNDGDLDLIVNHVNSIASIYRNNANELTDNNFIKIKLKGNQKNVFAIGTKVILSFDNQQITQRIIPSRGYQSAVEPVLTFGLGKHTAIPKVIIEWQDGKQQLLENVAVNQTLEIEYVPNRENTNLTPKVTPLFQPFDAKVSIEHRENNYNDFDRQPLLLHMLSTQGPKICKGDVNGDSLEDFFIGGAKGQSGHLFIQQNDGSFQEKANPAFEVDAVAEDMDCTFFDANGDAHLDLYVCAGGSEFDPNDPALQDRLYLNDGKGNFKKSTLPKMLSSTSCVSVADFDNDGDMDLFIGGRLVPNHYPMRPKSYLLENDGRGNFQVVTEKKAPDLLNIGMITAADWKDLNNDGQLELILLGEWMPPTLLHQQNGQFKILENNIWQNAYGWWTALAIADMDGDGDLDMVAGNFGWNTQLKATKESPLALFTGDFNNTNTLHPILAVAKEKGFEPLLYRDDLVQQIPKLKKDYLKYADYAKANLNDLFGETMTQTDTLFVNHLASSYFENKGNFNFDIRPLPTMAQISPVHAIAIMDVNRDGHLDILLGGNFTESRVQFGRHDASKGTLLLGDGKGNFLPSLNREIGLQIRGNVRDFESLYMKDGSTKIVVARNNAPLIMMSMRREIK